MRQSFVDLIEQWDKLSKTPHPEQFTSLDLLPWMNFLAFDIISNLSFGEAFGMVRKGEDIAEIRMTPKSPVTYAPAIGIFSARSEFNAAMGCLPHLKPYARYFPGMNSELAHVNVYHGLTTTKRSLFRQRSVGRPKSCWNWRFSSNREVAKCRQNPEGGFVSTPYGRT